MTPPSMIQQRDETMSEPTASEIIDQFVNMIGCAESLAERHELTPRGVVETKRQIRKARAAVAALRRTQPPTGSTLSRGNEIEADFYHLKAQEWAVEPREAERLINLAFSEYGHGKAYEAAQPTEDVKGLERELLGDEVNGGFIRDLCFTIWNIVRYPKAEDGKPDWGTDTLPTVQEGVKHIRERLADFTAQTNSRLAASELYSRERTQLVDAQRRRAEAAEARVEVLEKALEPFGDIDGEGDEDFPDDAQVITTFGRTKFYALTIGDLRRARAALTGAGKGER